jgi:hypothetical protein
MNYVIEMQLCSKYQFKNIYQSYYNQVLEDDLLNEFLENRYSTATVTQTILRSYHNLDIENTSSRTLFDQTISLIEAAHQAQATIRIPPSPKIVFSDDESDSTICLKTTSNNNETIFLGEIVDFSSE